MDWESAVRVPRYLLCARIRAMSQMLTLYRPVGLEELRLIEGGPG